MPDRGSLTLVDEYTFFILLGEKIMMRRVICVGLASCVLLATAAMAGDKAAKEPPKDASKEAPKEGPKEKPKKAAKKTKERRDPRRVYPPWIDAEEAGKEAIKMFDADKDGKISGDELWKCPGLKAAMTTVDPGGTGEVTAAMITDRIKAWQASKLGRMSLRCMITRNGEALTGAEVKFVPEKFLGDEMKTATGTTDQNGVAMLSIPVDKGPPGVPPGFYRVEITKAGEKIPTKYNTDTVFGQEVAIDAEGVREGIKFDLDY
jgi:hypothetical protein